MEILSYSTALLIGFLLGLLGGGGSILAVPVLVYLFAINPVKATGYSLFIVSVSAIFGSIKNIKSKIINKDAVVYFGVPSIISVFLTRSIIIPYLPETIIQIDEIVVSKDLLVMLFFAAIMFTSAIKMIKGRVKITEENKGKANYAQLVLQGIAVGLLAGFVGAGGGFLIVPALIFYSKLEVKEAIATSLAIIALNSSFGFVGELFSGTDVDWTFLSLFSGLSVVGIILGIKTSIYVSQNKLKKIFGYFVLAMSIYILFEEISKI